MKKEMEENDILERLFREEGLLTTSPGFTERVMQSVEASLHRTVKEYPPLISRKAWFIIGGVLAAIILAVIATIPQSGGSQLPYLDRITAFTQSLTVPHLTIKLDTGAILLPAVILGIVGMFLLFDLYLNRKVQGMTK